jgi:hypothetical protein
VLIVLIEAAEMSHLRITTLEASPFLLRIVIRRLPLEDVKEFKMLVAQMVMT